MEWTPFETATVVDCSHSLAWAELLTTAEMAGAGSLARASASSSRSRTRMAMRRLLSDIANRRAPPASAQKLRYVASKLATSKNVAQVRGGIAH